MGEGKGHIHLGLSPGLFWSNLRGTNRSTGVEVGGHSVSLPPPRGGHMKLLLSHTRSLY